jgi:hypothetical protein
LIEPVVFASWLDCGEETASELVREWVEGAGWVRCQRPSRLAGADDLVRADLFVLFLIGAEQPTDEAAFIQATERVERLLQEARQLFIPAMVVQQKGFSDPLQGAGLAKVEALLDLARPLPRYFFAETAEIPQLLRGEWSETFRDLLQLHREEHRMEGFLTQLAEIAQLNETLKRYLEEVVSKVSPEKSEKLIKTETIRLKEMQQIIKLAPNRAVNYLISTLDVSTTDVFQALKEAGSAENFLKLLQKKTGSELVVALRPVLEKKPWFLKGLREAREILGVPPWEHTPEE